MLAHSLYVDDSDRHTLQSDLNELITAIFRKRPKLSYFQVKRLPHSIKWLLTVHH
jgi:hypothetical protein